MLLLFRKLRNKLMQKNKVSTYLLYALGEIILVVIGILIAVRINNWNENRKIRKDEDRIVAQLHTEFSTNLEQLNYINEKNKTVLNALDRVLGLIPIQTNKIDLDTLSQVLFETYDFNTFDPLEGSIEELQHSSFNIISDKRLRSLLLSWETTKNDFKDDEQFAIDYAKDYNKYLQRHVSAHFGLKKPGADLSFLNSTEFENWVYVRQLYFSDIVDSEDFKRLESMIIEIIELTGGND